MGRKSKLVWNWISEGQMWPLPGYQAFWLPPSLPVPCSSLYRKHGGGKTGWVGGWVGREGGRETRRGGRRKCVWMRGICSEVVYNTLRCRLCRKGNHFSCWETSPHVNSQIRFLSLLSFLIPSLYENEILILSGRLKKSFSCSAYTGY